MTRDERMAKLLDCVNYYAFGKHWDGGLAAKEVLREVAEDELYQWLLKEKEQGD